VLVGAIVGFAASLGEFGAVITFAANIPGQTQTLPLAIYSALQSPGGEATAARLSLVSVVLAVIFLMCAELAGRRLRLRVGR
jgi:molybdate transport system permease protein